MFERPLLIAGGILLMLVLAVLFRMRANVSEPHSSSDAARMEASPERYGVGRLATASEIAERDITVFPSGAGLPVGRGDALRGEQVYATQCAGCHGARGEGGLLGPALAGGIGSLDTERPKQTVGSYWPYATSLFDYTRRAMPYQAPGSLSPDDVYAVTAYTLYLNGIVGKRDVLDEKTLPIVQMPNRDGFIADPRPDVHRQR